MYGYGNGAAIGMVVAGVLALIGGIVLYFTFLSGKNEGKFKGFWGWTYDFLSFKKMFIEAFLKVCYLIMTLFVTLASFVMISESFLAFLALLVVGNIGVRIVYEFSLVLLLICRNTTEINKKLSKEVQPEKKEEVTET